MIVRAKRYGSQQDLNDMDMLEIDEDVDILTRTFPQMRRASGSRGGLDMAPILELDDDFDDFDASQFVERERAYQ